MEEHSEEKAIQNTLENISKAQEFLESKNIKYKMFCGWNIFDNDLDLKGIDTSNFWFYSDKKINYGGMREWIAGNLEKRLWTRATIGHKDSSANTPGWALIDTHPSNEAQSFFTEDVLIPLLEEMEKLNTD